MGVLGRPSSRCTDFLPGPTNGDLLGPVNSMTQEYLTEDAEKSWFQRWKEQFSFRKWGMKLAVLCAFGYCGWTDTLKDNLSGVPGLSYMSKQQGWGKFCWMLLGGFLYEWAIEPHVDQLWQYLSGTAYTEDSTKVDPSEPKNEDPSENAGAKSPPKPAGGKTWALVTGLVVIVCIGVAAMLAYIFYSSDSQEEIPMPGQL